MSMSRPRPSTKDVENISWYARFPSAEPSSASGLTEPKVKPRSANGESGSASIELFANACISEKVSCPRVGGRDKIGSPFGLDGFQPLASILVTIFERNCSASAFRPSIRSTAAPTGSFFDLLDKIREEINACIASLNVLVPTSPGFTAGPSGLVSGASVANRVGKTPAGVTGTRGYVFVSSCGIGSKIAVCSIGRFE